MAIDCNRLQLDHQWRIVDLGYAVTEKSPTTLIYYDMLRPHKEAAYVMVLPA